LEWGSGLDVMDSTTPRRGRADHLKGAGQSLVSWRKESSTPKLKGKEIRKEC